MQVPRINQSLLIYTAITITSVRLKSNRISKAQKPKNIQSCSYWDFINNGGQGGIAETIRICGKPM